MATISPDGIAPQRIPSASGISNFARIRAGGFAASTITTMWDGREALHQSRPSDVSTEYNAVSQQAVSHLNYLGLSDQQAYGLLTHNMVQQSYLMSSLDLFWISGLLSILWIGIMWLVRKPNSNGIVSAVAD